MLIRNVNLQNKSIIWLMVTTIPGLEDIVLKEAFEKIDVLESDLKFCNISGRVSMKIPEDQFHKVFTLRSIEHIIQLLKTFKIDLKMNCLNQIYNEVYNCNVPLESTFRATCERIGKHDFTSIDVQKIAGQALVDKYKRKVDLKNPETIVRVDVIHDICIIGIQKTKRSLRIRYPKVFQHYSALNPIIAYAMLKLANVKPNDKILDAFCGSGTIIIEAAQIWEKIELLGIDISPKSIEGAWKNSEVAKVKNKVKFLVGDSTKLNKFLPENYKFDKVISNLPFGIRSSRLKIIPKIYREFLNSIKPFLKESSIICLLTIHKNLLESISKELNYSILESRPIIHGGLQAWIILLKPLENKENFKN